MLAGKFGLKKGFDWKVGSQSKNDDNKGDAVGFGYFGHFY